VNASRDNLVKQTTALVAAFSLAPITAQYATCGCLPTKIRTIVSNVGFVV